MGTTHEQSGKQSGAAQSQIDAFSRYLVGAPAPEAVRERYAQAIANTTSSLSPHEAAQLRFMINHPWTIGALDTALALTAPLSEVRRRLFIAFALLEATPEYASKFLPRQRSPFYLVVLAGVGLRALCRALLGICLLRVVRS